MNDYEKMASVDLVKHAMGLGLNVRGKTREGILEMLEVQEEKTIALPPEEATLCARRSCADRIMIEATFKAVPASPQEVVLETVEDVVGEPYVEPAAETKIPWGELCTLAKSKGIKTYGKKRLVIEAELAGMDGENVKD